MEPGMSASRGFSVDESDGYILSKGLYRATVRLNLQHFLLQRTLNFTIHPAIKLGEGPMIADVATGTTLWALDALRELPTAHVHGFDVDITQGPIREFSPSNLQLTSWDIFQDPPTELCGKFDLVHVRMIFLVLAGHGCSPVLRRLYSLLKPGGWLQWEEVDTTQMHVRKSSKAISSPALDAIMEMSRSGGQHDWVMTLPDMLEKEGFVEADIKSYEEDASLLRANTDMHLLTAEEFALGLVANNTADPEKIALGKKIIGLARDGHQESMLGAALCYPRMCCTARKPLVKGH